jgi:hypothetical protein
MGITTGKNPGLAAILSVSIGKRWFCLWWRKPKERKT